MWKLTRGVFSWDRNVTGRELHGTAVGRSGRVDGKVADVHRYPQACGV